MEDREGDKSFCSCFSLIYGIEYIQRRSKKREEKGKKDDRIV